MAANEADYSNYIVYGPEANCTLALCPVQLSVYQYQPTLAGNIAFLGPLRHRHGQPHSHRSEMADLVFRDMHVLGMCGGDNWV